MTHRRIVLFSFVIIYISSFFTAACDFLRKNEIPPVTSVPSHEAIASPRPVSTPESTLRPTPTLTPVPTPQTTPEPVLEPTPGPIPVSTPEITPTPRPTATPGMTPSLGINIPFKYTDKDISRILFNANPNKDDFNYDSYVIASSNWQMFFKDEPLFLNLKDKIYLISSWFGLPNRITSVTSYETAISWERVFTDGTIKIIPIQNVIRIKLKNEFGQEPYSVIEISTADITRKGKINFVFIGPVGEQEIGRTQVEIPPPPFEKREIFVKFSKPEYAIPGGANVPSIFENNPLVDMSRNNFYVVASSNWQTNVKDYPSHLNLKDKVYIFGIRRKVLHDGAYNLKINSISYSRDSPNILRINVLVIDPVFPYAAAPEDTRPGTFVKEISKMDIPLKGIVTFIFINSNDGSELTKIQVGIE